MSPATTVGAEQAAIMGRISSQLGGTFAVGSEIAWPNTDFNPPQANAGAKWIEPIVNRFDVINTDLGSSPTGRHPGLLTVNVRTPLNQGDGVALGHAETVAAAFRNVAFDGLHFWAVTIRDGKKDPEHPGWFRVQVDCPFYRDTIY